ncbi:MAG TPA: hypothetical protein ENJ41_06335 [Oceanospirillales bacterium]|nr:hypothetical protein [Oceanospirillales bacterium]
MKKITFAVLLTIHPLCFAQLAFDGGFETGNHQQWSDLNWNLNRPESEQFQIVTTPVRQGLFAAKTIVHDGDEFLDTGGERCDLERPANFNEHEGDEYWYAFSTQFDSNWQNPGPVPGDWLLIADWHASANYPDICQPLQLETDGDGKLKATVLSGNVEGYNCFNGSGTAFYHEQVLLNNVSPGLWHDFIIHIKWTSSNNGLIEIWHLLEGEKKFSKLLELNNIPTLQFKTNPANPDSPYFILAHYRDSLNTHTSVLYHDGFRQATTAAALADGKLYNLADYIFHSGFE